MPFQVLNLISSSDFDFKYFVLLNKHLWLSVFVLLIDRGVSLCSSVVLVCQGFRLLFYEVPMESVIIWVRINDVVIMDFV
ncbi:hypothetical protein SLEP1_g51293 [Rubroshorea leprosula]|uniref:Uncharacterized protein n=1 Tax=Rubroshorea leprosula TaxID=152421 RepID=A0AAV5M6B6_9ROSI|nr:hypothetical protein SLEP1_g51293 [Rubroshorea leprosula]